MMARIRLRCKRYLRSRGEEGLAVPVVSAGTRGIAVRRDGHLPARACRDRRREEEMRGQEPAVRDVCLWRARRWEMIVAQRSPIVVVTGVKLCLGLKWDVERHDVGRIV